MCKSLKSPINFFSLAFKYIFGFVLHFFCTWFYEVAYVGSLKSFMMITWCAVMCMIVIQLDLQRYLVELHHQGDSVHDDQEEDEVLKRCRGDKAPHLKPKTYKGFVIIIWSFQCSMTIKIWSFHKHRPIILKSWSFQPWPWSLIRHIEFKRPADKKINIIFVVCASITAVIWIEPKLSSFVKNFLFCQEPNLARMAKSMQDFWFLSMSSSSSASPSSLKVTMIKATKMLTKKKGKTTKKTM